MRLCGNERPRWLADGGEPVVTAAAPVVVDETIGRPGRPIAYAGHVSLVVERLPEIY
jgi:hypothetical protein